MFPMQTNRTFIAMETNIPAEVRVVSALARSASRAGLHAAGDPGIIPAFRDISLPA